MPAVASMRKKKQWVLNKKNNNFRSVIAKMLAGSLSIFLYVLQIWANFGTMEML